MSRRTRATDPRDQAEALGFDTGSRAIPVDVVDVAVGARQVIKVSRRRSNVATIEGVTLGMIAAADRFARAWEHAGDGKGMGPIDPQVERARIYRGDGLGVQLLAQERAITAAAVHRIGTQAAGLIASPLVHWVVIQGGGLREWETRMQWRNGTARGILLAALLRMADAYECA